MKKFVILSLAVAGLVLPIKGEELKQSYEKAYFLETAKGETEKAIEIYRTIAATPVTDDNREVVLRGLKRLVKLYEKESGGEPVNLDEYFTGLNLDFEAGVQSEESHYPRFWYGGGKGYRIKALKSAAKNGEFGCEIKFTGGGKEAHGFGTITGTLDVKHFAGKRLRYSGMMKLDDVSSFAGLWMRSDIGKKPATFYNMNDREVKGTRDWEEYSFEIEIPENATNINFGVLMAGKGTIWADDLKIEIVDK